MVSACVGLWSLRWPGRLASPGGWTSTGWVGSTPRPGQNGDFAAIAGPVCSGRKSRGVIFGSAGSLDCPTGLDLAREIFTADAGDYCGLRQGAGNPAAGERLTCGCLCGGVRFLVPGPAGAVTACHCSRCRRVSGHFAASFDVAEKAVDDQARGELATQGTCGGGSRGFCRTCGLPQWFRARNGGFSVEAGVVPGVTGGYLVRHIHVADKGDDYRLDDGVPLQCGAG